MSDDEHAAWMQAMADQMDASSRERKRAEKREYVEGPRQQPRYHPERHWREGQIECCVVRTDVGHLCGYARVPDDHPWVGLDYDDPVPNPRALDDDMLTEEAMDEFGAIPVFAAMFSEDGVEEFTTTLAAQVRVHGGVTFCGVLSHVHDVSHGWWIGFDCGHAGDAVEREYEPEWMRPFHHGGHVWTVDEVVLECRRMASDIEATATTNREE